MLHEKKEKCLPAYQVVCVRAYRVSWCTKLGAPSGGQKMVFGIEEYLDGIRYLDISPKISGYGYDTSISIYRIL